MVKTNIEDFDMEVRGSFSCSFGALYPSSARRPLAQLPSLSPAPSPRAVQCVNHELTPSSIKNHRRRRRPSRAPSRSLRCRRAAVAATFFAAAAAAAAARVCCRRCFSTHRWILRAPSHSRSQGYDLNSIIKTVDGGNIEKCAAALSSSFSLFLPLLPPLQRASASPYPPPTKKEVRPTRSLFP